MTRTDISKKPQSASVTFVNAPACWGPRGRSFLPIHLPVRQRSLPESKQTLTLDSQVCLPKHKSVYSALKVMVPTACLCRGSKKRSVVEQLCPELPARSMVCARGRGGGRGSQLKAWLTCNQAEQGRRRVSTLCAVLGTTRPPRRD